MKNMLKLLNTVRHSELVSESPNLEIAGQARNNASNIIIWAFVAILSASMSWSCTFLDVSDAFEESLKWDSIWTSQKTLERYIWSVVTGGEGFPDEGNKLNKLGSFASDEAFAIDLSLYPALRFTMGGLTPENITSYAEINIWNNMYIIIRRTNTILANMHKAEDLVAKPREYEEIRGYVYFMRAYAYYRLVMHYGPVVIVGDEVFDTNKDPIDYDLPRATFDESVDYVCGELERAAAMMPGPEAITQALFGRPTSGSALGLSARLRLIQASPLWNGGEAAVRTYGTWRRSTDGVHYVYQGTPIEERWAVAAAICERIINTGQYELHHVFKTDNDNSPVLPLNVSPDDFPYGAGNIDVYRSISDMFSGESAIPRIREFLWAQRSSGLENYSRHSFPFQLFNGYGTVSVPQKIIDNFLMADGNTIYESSDEYPYFADGMSQRTNDINFSRIYNLRRNIHRMYENREIRFYAFIGFNGAEWMMSSNTQSERRDQQFWYHFPGNADKNSGLQNINYRNATGYTLRKFVHYEDSWGTGWDIAAQGSKRMPKAYPIIRYAEILLAYVEAMNNISPGVTHIIEGSDGKTYEISRDMNKMAFYFNQVRFRAGLPGLTTDELASPQRMQEIIERERMIELLHENARFWDVRRWGQYETSEREPIMGMNLDASGLAYYNVTQVNHLVARNRVVDRKLILLPLPLTEVRKAPSLDQNPGYQF